MFEWIAIKQAAQFQKQFYFELALLTSCTIAFIYIRLFKTNSSPLPVYTSKKLFPLSLLILSISFFFINFDPALSRIIDLYHEGETLTPGSIENYQAYPYKDIWLQHGFIKNFFLPKLLFAVGGDNLLNFRLGYSIADTLAYPIFFCLALLVFKNRIILSLSVIFLISGTNYWLSLRQTTYFLSIICLIAYVRKLSVEKANLSLLFFSGLFSALSIWNSLEFGLYALSGNFFGLLIITLMHEDSSNSIFKKLRKQLLPFLTGCIIATAPFVLYLYSHSALSETIDNFKGQILYQSGIWGLPYPTFTEIYKNKTVSQIFQDQNLFFYLTPLLYAVALIHATIFTIKSRKESYSAVFTVITLHAIISFRTCLGRSDFGHWIDATAISWLVLLALLEIHIYACLKTEKVKNIILRAPFIFLFLAYTYKAYALFTPTSVGSQKLFTITALEEKTNFDSAYSQIQPQLTVLNVLKSEIDAISSPQDCMYDFSNQPGFYYFTKRKPASRFFSPVYIATKEQEKEVIEDIKSCKTAAVILRANTPFDAIDGMPTEKRTPALFKFLTDNYEFHTTVQGIEVYKLRYTQHRSFE